MRSYIRYSAAAGLRDSKVGTFTPALYDEAAGGGGAVTAVTVAAVTLVPAVPGSGWRKPALARGKWEKK